MNRHTDTESRPDQTHRPTGESARQQAHLRLALMRAAAAEGRRDRNADEDQPDPLRDFWRQTR